VTEYFLNIHGYKDLYKISNLGNICSLRSKTLLIPVLNKKTGYYYVSLYKNKKYEKKYIHRLVATSFIFNKYNFSIVSHKDENKANNNINNLKWISDKQQKNLNQLTIDNTHIKKVIQLDKNNTILNIYNSATIAANVTGSILNKIIACCRHKRKTTNNFKWKYYIIRRQVNENGKNN